ncbi:HET-domain-containing protein, partial [Acephala macrosclerotiorum]
MSAKSCYTPLPVSQEDEPWIRVLSLEQGDWDDPIKCSLTPKRLRDLRYCGFGALSYVWGHASDTRPILVDGEEFQATVNLESALRHLRHNDRSRTLWVDAVCINQQDVLERNSQVLLMGKIYETAASVIIWLGESTPSS